MLNKSNTSAAPKTIPSSSNSVPEDEISLGQKTVNILAVGVPGLALLAGIILLWGKWVNTADLILLAILYPPTALGITVGFHRLLTHRSFECKRWVRKTLTIMGCLALEGDPITWVADHRKHHQHSDHEGDPHSPHLHEDDGMLGTIKGFIHAHMGWLLSRGNRATQEEKEKYCKDLLNDNFMVWVSKRYWLFVAITIILPGFILFAFTGSPTSILTGILWGGIIRVGLLHHVTYSVNSLCHTFGSRRFRTNDHSKNLALLALPTLGEAYHHNHHAFPTSAKHGLKWYEVDLSAAFISLLVKTNLAWGMRVPSTNSQELKLTDKKN